MPDAIENGPDAGRTLPAEDSSYEDPETGARVRQLTDARAHSQHFYFTDDAWYDGGDRLVIGSDRTGIPNYFSVDLGTGKLTQLTDLEPMRGRERYHYRGLDLDYRGGGAVDPDAEALYFWYGDHLAALDLDTLELRSLYEKPGDYFGDHLGATADGRYVCTNVTEDLVEKGEFAVDPTAKVPMREYMGAEPESRVLKVPTDGGEAEVLHEGTYLSHVNASPTSPELITYCQEGPWGEVDNRIWGLNVETGERWQIRPREREGERVGHEYWLANGEDVGYHGHTDGEPFVGVVRYDDTERTESRIDVDTHHSQANARDLIVGDSHADYPYLLAWRLDRDAGEYVGPRLIASHGSTEQPLHVHPRLSPDGEEVLFTSDRSGYANVSLAEVREFDALPEA